MLTLHPAKEKFESRSINFLGHSVSRRQQIGSARIVGVSRTNFPLPRDANILDSRAFAYLKKGSLDDSLADYDAVLRIDPRKAISLYGRAVVKWRKGDIAGSEADRAAAQVIMPSVADHMARYEIK